jgi:hypothetical protein
MEFPMIRDGHGYRAPGYPFLHYDVASASSHLPETVPDENRTNFLAGQNSQPTQ